MTVVHASFTESSVEDAALVWLKSFGWNPVHGPDIGPDTPDAERADYGKVVLEQRLRASLAQFNPDLPTDALEDAFRRLTRPEGPTLETRNRAFHRMLVAGVTVEYRADDGAIQGAQAQRSTSSPSSRTGTSAGPTWCCSSTACPWG